MRRCFAGPLLVGGYKMDIRLYVVVTSARPLRAFVYREGLTRFGTEKYDLSDIGNVFKHLTNYSLNKSAPAYETEKDVIGGGAKWQLTRLMQHLREHGHDTDLLWTRIRHVCILTVLILMPLVPMEAAGCFELFGFDILVDQALHPWLLEVNAAPALAAGSDIDWAVKEPLLRDLMGLLDFEDAGTHDVMDRKPRASRKSRSRRPSRPTSKRGGSRSESGTAARPPSGRAQQAGASAAEQVIAARAEANAEPGAAEDDTDRRCYGGYELLFPFNKKVAELSEQCSSGPGGKALAEHGKIVREVVGEVRRLEEEAALKAVGGDERLFKALLKRDIDTAPSLPGRKEEGQRRADATLRGKSNGQGEAGLAAPTKPKGRFDLAASLADTDAQIAALLKPSLPLTGT